jgi:hypothetical protein
MNLNKNEKLVVIFWFPLVSPFITVEVFSRKMNGKTETGDWKPKNGERRTENGKWKTENGEWKVTRFLNSIFQRTWIEWCYRFFFEILNPPLAPPRRGIMELR